MIPSEDATSAAFDAAAGGYVYCKAIYITTTEGVMPRLVRKNVFLDPAALARAQRILGAATESQAVREAIDLVAFRIEVMRRYDRVAGKAPRFRDPWKAR